MILRRRTYKPYIQNLILCPIRHKHKTEKKENDQNCLNCPIRHKLHSKQYRKTSSHVVCPLPQNSYRELLQKNNKDDSSMVCHEEDLSDLKRFSTATKRQCHDLVRLLMKMLEEQNSKCKCGQIHDSCGQKYDSSKYDEANEVWGSDCDSTEIAKTHDDECGQYRRSVKWQWPQRNIWRRPE